ncbi:unnamed protein product [Brassica oleracea]
MDFNPQKHRKTSLERQRRKRLAGRSAHNEAKKTFELVDQTSKRPTHRHCHRQRPDRGENPESSK